MTETMQETSGTRILESVQEAEHAALEAVRKFVDTVDGAFPDLTTDDGPRRKIIDSAFKMVENLVGASNKLAENVLEVTTKAMEESSGRAAKK